MFGTANFWCFEKNFPTCFSRLTRFVGKVLKKNAKEFSKPNECATILIRDDQDESPKSQRPYFFIRGKKAINFSLGKMLG